MINPFGMCQTFGAQRRCSVEPSAKRLATWTANRGLMADRSAEMVVCLAEHGKAPHFDIPAERQPMEDGQVQDGW